MTMQNNEIEWVMDEYSRIQYCFTFWEPYCRSCYLCRSGPFIPLMSLCIERRHFTAPMAAQPNGYNKKPNKKPSNIDGKWEIKEKCHATGIQAVVMELQDSFFFSHTENGFVQVVVIWRCGLLEAICLVQHSNKKIGCNRKMEYGQCTRMVNFHGP